MHDKSNVRKAMAAAFTVALLIGTIHSASIKEEDRPCVKPRAKHVILFVGDGMQLEHEVAASRYLYGGDAKLSFHQLPYKNSATTWDVTTYNRYAKLLGQAPYDPSQIIPTIGYDPLKGGFEPYPQQVSGIDDLYFLDADNDPLTRPFATDSASAATAWATGHKTENGNIAWLPGDPDNGNLTTVAELLRQKLGYAIGVVSTVPFNHATPAAHVSHSKSRKDYHAIALEILRGVKPEVVIGGGHPQFDATCPDPTEPATCMPVYMPLDLYQEMKVHDGDEYVFVERSSRRDGAVALLQKAQEAAAQGKKLFG
ncbi:MAG: hypothetical protein HGA84_08750, partial [Syntrophobacteraceae bacterium]|nr:hypothetical protein [Syntrophobacteraceae bacterium]